MNANLSKFQLMKMLIMFDFLRARASIASIARTVLAMVILSWSLSQPCTDRSPGEIETSSFRRMIA